MYLILSLTPVAILERISFAILSLFSVSYLCWPDSTNVVYNIIFSMRHAFTFECVTVI